MDILWILFSFMAGGFCGMVIMALMNMASRQDRPVLDPRGVSPLERVTQ